MVVLLFVLFVIYLKIMYFIMVGIIIYMCRFVGGRNVDVIVRMRRLRKRLDCEYFELYIGIY